MASIPSSTRRRTSTVPWFLAAVVAFPLLFVLAVIVEAQLLGYQAFDPVVVIIFLWGNGTAVAIGLAITRHGLYEIDRIISRTVTYALLTAVIAAIYLSAVSGLGSLLPAQSQLAVAGSTLLAAALINPLRRRILSFVDRQFNRANYNRERIIERLGRRMSNEVNLGDVAHELEVVARTTMQPAKLSVWVRGS